MPWSLRQSVVQLWCCARATSGSVSGVAAVALAGARRDRRKCAGVFGKEMAPICIEYEADCADADKFDRVFESRSLEALSELLESDAPIERLVEPKHPWAEDPRSIGALAAVHIALLASVAANADPEYKAAILNAGAEERLVSFLGSEEPDRVQAAVVALSYLTDECAANACSLFDAGAVPLLIKHLESSVAGLRGAAASTLRHICIESEEYCKAFLNLGGMKGFVNLLDPASVNQFDPHRSMLEAVWNLEDVTTDPDGNVIEVNARLAVEHGAITKLEKLQVLDEEEVSGAADKLLSVLVQVREEMAQDPCEDCGGVT